MAVTAPATFPSSLLCVPRVPGTSFFTLLMCGELHEPTFSMCRILLYGSGCQGVRVKKGLRHFKHALSHTLEPRPRLPSL